MNILKDIRQEKGGVALQLEHEVVQLEIGALSGGFFTRAGKAYLTSPLSGVWASLTDLAGIHLFLEVAELALPWQASSLNDRVVCQFLDARQAADLGVKVMGCLASGAYWRYVQQVDLHHLEGGFGVWTEGQVLGFARFLIGSQGVWYIETM